jgi:hypothetical protein
VWLAVQPAQGLNRPIVEGDNRPKGWVNDCLRDMTARANLDFFGQWDDIMFIQFNNTINVYFATRAWVLHGFTVRGKILSIQRRFFTKPLEKLAFYLWLGYKRVESISVWILNVWDEC